VKQANYKKTNTIRFHLYAVSKVAKLFETKSRLMVARGWGSGEREVVSEYRVSVLQSEIILEILYTKMCE
jgi:hypothetical protein